MYTGINYDSVSNNYDYSRRAGVKTVELLIELLNPVEDTVILDIGCGTGNFLAELDGLSRKTVGIDISSGMLEQARTKINNASLISANAIHMPFIDQVFDSAICMTVLHHISDKNVFLSEVYRILRPRGCFLIQTCSHEQLLTFWMYHYFPQGLEIDRERIPDLDETSGMLTLAGFKDIRFHVCPFEMVIREIPELYLDKKYRDGNSLFSLLATEEIDEGCRKIKEDIRTGRYAEIIAKYDRVAEKAGGQLSFIKCMKK